MPLHPMAEAAKVEYGNALETLVNLVITPTWRESRVKLLRVSLLSMPIGELKYWIAKCQYSGGAAALLKLLKI